MSGVNTAMEIARLGMASLYISLLLISAAMLQIPRHCGRCCVLLALGYVAMIGAIFCVLYETSIYGF